MHAVNRIEAAEAAVSPAAVAVMATAVIVLLAATVVRVVPEHERLVVTRWGRVLRVVGPGIALRVPGVERWRAVSLLPFHLQAGVAAVSSDGVPVHVQVVGGCRVVDPARSLHAQPDPHFAAQAAIESHVAHEVGRANVNELLGLRLNLESTTPAELDVTTGEFGVQVDDIAISDIEVRLTMSLLESLRSSARAENGR